MIAPNIVHLPMSRSTDRVRLFDAMSHHSRDYVFALDTESRIIGVNEAAERVLGRPEQELLGKSFVEFVTSGALPESCGVFESELIAACGRSLPVEIRKDRRIVIARDLAERDALEENARQAHKMETLGVLAGGIAHDFNNLLTGILGYAYLLQAEPDLEERFGEAIDVIVKSSERAAQLTTQLLGFAREDKSSLTAVDLHATIREIVQLLKRTIDKKVRVAEDLRASDFHVMADGSQMYQVLLNLCLNARDAMPDGGDLRLATRNAGTSIVISVADTGSGVPEEIRARIFEPFFTTKPADRGTGMGLAMVRAIARNHGGAVSLDSETGKGSVFHVTLPVSRAAALPVPAQAVRRGGAGRILVVEDEPFVRQVLARMLTGFGYEVISLGDVESAVDYFRNNSSTIDVVILDQVMPGMNGMECLQILRSVKPGVKAILSSGLGSGDVPEVEYLPKPYQPDQLACAVRKAMGLEPATISAD